MELSLEAAIAPLEQHISGARNQNVTPEEQRAFTTALLRASAAFRRVEWSPETQLLLSALGADRQLSEQNVSDLIVQARGVNQSQNVRSALGLLEFYHWARAVLAMATAAKTLLVDVRLAASKTEEHGLLELTISDYDEGPIDLQRLQAVTTALGALHDSVASLLGVESRARVAVVDSGSDIVMVLLAAAAVIKTTGAVYNEVVNRVRFRGNELAERNFQTLRDGLSTLADVRQQERAENLSPDAAEKLEFMVLGQISSLIGMGALPAKSRTDVESKEEFLLANRSTKLLSRPSGDNDDPDGSI